MSLTQAQQDALEAIKDAETPQELAEAAQDLRPEDRVILARDIRAQTEIIKLAKGL